MNMGSYGQGKNPIDMSSPMRQDKKKTVDPNPPTYNQQDSSWAIGIRSEEDLTTNSNSAYDYRPTGSEIDKGSMSNAKEILKKTDAKVKASGNYGVVKEDAKRLLKADYKNNQNKKRVKKLKEKAVKGTEANTFGVLKSQKKS